MLNMKSTEEKKTQTTKKKKGEEEEEEEEKEIWSGTDGMYDATRYTKKKTDDDEEVVERFFLHVLKALQISTSFAFDAKANKFIICEHRTLLFCCSTFDYIKKNERNESRYK
jgi:hypothetical protein